MYVLSKDIIQHNIETLHLGNHLGKMFIDMGDFAWDYKKMQLLLNSIC